MREPLLIWKIQIIRKCHLNQVESKKIHKIFCGCSYTLLKVWRSPRATPHLAFDVNAHERIGLNVNATLRFILSKLMFKADRAIGGRIAVGSPCPYHPGPGATRKFCSAATGAATRSFPNSF